MIDIIHTKDFFLGPLFFLLIILFAMIWRNAFYKKDLIRRYFIPALVLRLIGAVTQGLLVHYYFGGGDTTKYFHGSMCISKLITTDPLLTFKLLTVNPEYLKIHGLLSLYFENNPLVSTDASYAVMKFAAFFNLFTFNTYLPTAMLLSCLGFVGCWKIYKVFYELFPKLHKELAIAVLFIPSVFFWGSGLLKEPIVFLGLGYLLHSSYNLFIKRNNILKSIIQLIISSMIIISIKVYIFICFFPALLIWIFMTQRQNIRDPWLRLAAGPIFLALFLGIGGLTVYKITSSEKFKEYSMEEVAEQATKFANYYGKVNHKVMLRGGKQISNYSLGEIDPSFSGLLKKFPQAVNVTLFRPYMWEVIKPINLLSALESLVFLVFTLLVFIKRGPFNTFRIIFKSPEALFCLIFTIIFAFIVGVSTANFGTLTRYKIPCMPFYLIALFIILKSPRAKKQIRKKKKRKILLSGE